ncbi:class GN sortase [Shewanella sp. 10N.261.52.F9]|uniref:class GN sortase n=1 Tax=Shewanella sp. 10N.261.52.F9 TaxID=3229684 RepID=UPI00354D1183
MQKIDVLNSFTGLADKRKSQSKGHYFHRLVAGLLLFVGIGLFVQGGYMQAKAHFAQFLIQQAWQKTLLDRKPHKPWSWADTHPVAKLDFLAATISNTSAIHAEREGSSLYVLSGASGRNLAFGPALMLSSANINSRGNTVIAGHRDTHFARLNGITIGQLIRLQGVSGKSLLYKVTAAKITHESDINVIQDGGEVTLTLVTCYPFGAEFSGGPLRYIVQAKPIN